MSMVEGQRYQGKVKWYNPNKGYGFILMGEEDIFVHQNDLKSDAVKTLLEDQQIEFTYMVEDGKAKAKEVSGPNGSKLVKPHKSRLNPQWAKRLENSDIKLGTVKWFDPKKGYGFLFHENGDGEVFVHNSQITSSGFRALAEGQDVEFKLVLEAGSDGSEQQKAREVTGPGGHPVVPPIETGRSGNNPNMPLIGGMGMAGMAGMAGMGMGGMGGMGGMMMGGMGAMGPMGMRAGLLNQNGMLATATGKMTGTVKWYNPEKGYGFIISATTGKDCFAHQTEIKSSPGSTPVLVENQFVEFTLQTKNGQLRACGITVLGDQMMNAAMGKRGKSGESGFSEGGGKRSQFNQEFNAQQQQFAQYPYPGVEGERQFSRQGFDPYSGAYYAGTPTGQGAGSDFQGGYPAGGGQSGFQAYSGAYYQ